MSEDIEILIVDSKSAQSEQLKNISRADMATGLSVLRTLNTLSFWHPSQTIRDGS